MAALVIARSDELPRLPLAPGIQYKPLVGTLMNINVVELQPGAVAAVHIHDEEQLGYVVSGWCDFSDGTQTWRLEPGDTYFAASGVPHGATAGDKGCVIIDAFTPPRAAVLDAMREAGLL